MKHYDPDKQTLRLFEVRKRKQRKKQGRKKIDNKTISHFSTLYSLFLKKKKDVLLTVVTIVRILESWDDSAEDFRLGRKLFF
jgi:hypothetical protein